MVGRGNGGAGGKCEPKHDRHEVRFKYQSMSMYITWVYADTEDRRRSQNWDEIRTTGRGLTEAWICQGYFNAITHQHEKEGGIRKTQRQMDEFIKFINDIEMEDMGAKGQRFTWYNNMRGEERAYERIDRVLVNAQWATHFKNGQCLNEVAVGSDHAPIVLTMDWGRRRGKQSFRFEEMWFESPECKEVIKRSWEENNDGSQGRRLWPKLGGCRRNMMV